MYAPNNDLQVDRSQIAPNNRLTDKHYTECVTKRGLSREWVLANCRSMEIKDASTRLGYTSKSAGIWLEGTNGFGQFRPNKPWKNEGDKKAPKYRTAMGEEYDAMIPRHPSDPQYGTDLEALKALCYQIDGHPCLILAEGLFKAIAGCSNGFPTVAIAGVEMGLTPAKNDVQGKRFLVETLEKLARAGFGFIIAFDADDNPDTNLNVVFAQRKLAQQLIRFKVPVYIATGLWRSEQGKGMDDYIQANGSDSFRDEVLKKAPDIGTWEQQFVEDDKDEDISEASVARELGETYRTKLAWHIGNKSWYYYEYENKLGVWGEISPEEAVSIVMTELELKGVRHYSSHFVCGTLNLLKGILKIVHWEVRPGFICLQDCVLDVNTRSYYPHEPGYRMLSQLPFKWADRNIGCDRIKDWLLEFCEGREEWVQVLRAALNATVAERGKVSQRFVELMGAGGTGKGTMLRLVQALIGTKNYQITDLKQLEQNRFETAALYGKKAIIITDSERYSGSVDVLKRVTGGDDLRHEKKGVQQTGNFHFTGVVWIGTNEPIQSSEYTNALPRRRLSMSFDKVVPVNERRNLEEEFKPYLPGFLDWVLQMSAEEVNSYFCDTNNKVPSLAAVSREVLTETNHLANWADECLYHDPNAETGIGDINQSSESFLYPNYVQWAANNGQGTLSKQRFSAMLLNLLKAQLNINAVKRKTKKGRFITA
jgi:putative DNA primase/helicase